ncbi:MAG: hypothetical protein ACTSWP_06365 [Candidatus Freyarchaeota archaeon]|nr:hypothetical protein [Candidatus Freyrarchaeum guaymaensis]
MKKILSRGEVKKSLSDLVFDVSFKNAIIRLYKTGKMVVRKVASRDEVESILNELLR